MSPLEGQLLFALAYAAFVAVYTHKRVLAIRPTIVDVVLLYTALYFSGSTVLGYRAGSLPDYHWGPVAVVWASFFLYALGLIYAERFWLSRIDVRSLSLLVTDAATVKPALLGLTWAGLFALRLMLAAEGVLIPTRASDEEIANSYRLQVSRSITVVAGLGCTVVAASQMAKQPAALPAIVLLTEFTFAFVASRRSVLELAMVSIFALLLFRPHIARKPAFYGVAFAGLGLFYYWGMPFFLALRDEFSMVEVSGTNAFSGVASVVPGAFDQIGWMREHGLEENVRERAAVHAFNLEIASRQSLVSTRDMMVGEAIASNFLMMIPSFLYPDKLLWAKPETGMQYFFGIYAKDEGNNWPATGVADFGTIGGFVVGLLFGSLLYAGQWVTSRLVVKQLPMQAALVVSGMLHAAIMVDTDPSVILSCYREAALLGLAMMPVSRNQ